MVNSLVRKLFFGRPNFLSSVSVHISRPGTTTTLAAFPRSKRRHYIPTYQRAEEFYVFVRPGHLVTPPPTPSARRYRFAARFYFFANSRPIPRTQVHAHRSPVYIPPGRSRFFLTSLSRHQHRFGRAAVRRRRRRARAILPQKRVFFARTYRRWCVWYGGCYRFSYRAHGERAKKFNRIRRGSGPWINDYKIKLHVRPARPRYARACIRARTYDNY